MQAPSAAQLRYRIKGTKVYVQPFAPRLSASAGGYDAGSTAPRFGRWAAPNIGPNAALGASLPVARTRSRRAVRNDGMADATIDVLCANIIGTGIKPQFNTRNAELNKLLAAKWSAWTDESDADGRFDFYGQQWLGVREMAVGGDCFARLRPRLPSDGLTVPLQVQLLASEFCPAELSEMRPDGYIQNGVEFNKIGRRVAYHLYRQHPYDTTGLNIFGSGQPVPVAAEEIAHLAIPREQGMVRGEPWLIRALIKLHEFAQYKDAQIVRQKIATMFAGFIQPDAFVGGAGEPDADGVALAPLESGTVQVLGPGEEINWTTPPSPGDQYEAFVREQMREIAVTVGVLYEQISGDYSKVNDRTWRAAINEFSMRLAFWQHSIVVFQLCRPVVRRWLELGLLSGAIVLPADVTLAEAARPKWLPQARPYINPVQDVQARREKVRAGFASRSQLVSEEGLDSEVIDDENARDNARADAKGLTYDSDARKTAQGGQNQAAGAQPGSGEREPEDRDEQEEQAR